MPDFIEFLPLYVRTEEQIRSDMDADVNAGLQPTDPQWVDTRPGQFFHMVTQPFVAEAARLHDFIATVPAVAFPEFAYGEYLDYHAASYNIERKAAVAAGGTAQFKGAVGTVVSTGTQIQTPQVDANVPPVVFATTATGTIQGPLTTPTGLTENTTAGGVLPAGSRYYAVAAYDAAGETLATAVVTVAVPAGNNQQVNLSWNPVPNAVGYWVYNGPSATNMTQRVSVSTNGFTDAGITVWAPAAPASANGTGGAIWLPIQAQDVGSVGNIGPNSLTQMLTFNTGVTSVTNQSGTINGEDVESDPDLQERLRLARQGQGPGTVTDYVAWALQWPGVQRAQAVPDYLGPGSVGVIVMDAAGGPLSTAVTEALQLALDPYPGLGGGVAPIDHQVTVTTPTIVPIAISATVTFRTGYSYDGANNTIAIRDAIMSVLTDYFAKIPPGESVLLDHLKALFYQVEGVYSVAISAPSGNVSIPSAAVPPQKAAAGTITLN